MHVKRIRLRSFKRFNDLTIGMIPQTSKLVIIAGPNGTGKSAIFEGFNSWRRSNANIAHPVDATYFPKVGSEPVAYPSMVEVEFHELPPADPASVKKSIWVRSAYRHDPDFSTTSLQRQQPLLDEPGLGRLIDAEKSVGSNYQRLVASTIASVFDESVGGIQVAELREQLIGRLKELMALVFDDLTLEGPGDPLADGTFFFTKGTSKNFRYLNLSAGEKATFDLLLDLILRISEYDDTVFCIDEPELHIGTRTQARLLEALVDVLPEKCQLWLATHSIGMMRAARDLSRANPGLVSFLDTTDLFFDAPVIMEPVVPDRQFWRGVLTVALDDLAELVAPETVVICEGHPTDQWDARCYTAIFAEQYPEVEFLSVGNCYDVQGDRAEIGAAVTTLVPGTKVIRVRDRDEMTSAEVQDVMDVGCRVLSRRHLESFLLSDDVLRALVASLGETADPDVLIAAREAAIASAVARGRAPDDYKAAAGDVYNAAKHLFGLTGSGTKASAFLAEVVAPLLKPGMPSYEALRRDIFD